MCFPLSPKRIHWGRGGGVAKNTGNDVIGLDHYILYVCVWYIYSTFVGGKYWGLYGSATPLYREIRAWKALFPIIVVHYSEDDYMGIWLAILSTAGMGFLVIKWHIWWSESVFATVETLFEMVWFFFTSSPSLTKYKSSPYSCLTFWIRSVYGT